MTLSLFHLMGFYAMLAFKVNAVDLGLPQDLTESPSDRGHTHVAGHPGPRHWRRPAARFAAQACGLSAAAYFPAI